MPGTRIGTNFFRPDGKKKVNFSGKDDTFYKKRKKKLLTLLML